MLGVAKKDLLESFSWPATIDEKFPECADLMRKKLVLHRRRYRRLSIFYVFWYRTFGVVEVVLGVGLTTLFVFPETQENTPLLASVSVLIAICAALRSFYGWESSWQLYRSQEVALAELVTRWEIALIRIASQPDIGTDEKLRALECTESTLLEAMDVLSHEQITFFNAVLPPEKVVAEREASIRRGQDGQNQGPEEASAEGEPSGPPSPAR